MASILVGFRVREPYSPTGTSSHSNLQNDRICDVMRETTVAATGVINGRARRNTLDDFSQCCLRAAHHAGPFDHVCDVSCHSTRFSRSFAVGGRPRVGGPVTSSCHSRRPFRVISLRASDLFGAQVCDLAKSNTGFQTATRFASGIILVALGIVAAWMPTPQRSP